MSRSCDASEEPVTKSVSSQNGSRHLPCRRDTEGVLYCTLRNWLLAVLSAFRVSPKKLSRFFAHGKKIYQR